MRINIARLKVTPLRRHRYVYGLLGLFSTCRLVVIKIGLHLSQIVENKRDFLLCVTVWNAICYNLTVDSGT